MASYNQLMQMDEEEILRLIKGENDRIEPEVGAAFLNYRFNRKLLEQNKQLAYATWVLAVVTAVLAIITWFHKSVCS